MTERVLLTGGRAPVALELARLLAAAGHRVYVADSVRFPVTRGSRAVTRSFRVPSPRFRTEAFVVALEHIVREHGITTLVPVCEEILHVAPHRERLGAFCRVFCDDFATLRSLHDKAAFVERAGALGLAVPRTARLTSEADLARALADPQPLVLKRTCTRFATDVVFRLMPGAPVDGVRPTAREPWIAQEHVPGREICTLSVAHAGRLVLHSAYPARLRAGPGATVHWSTVDDSGARQWVERFVAGTGFTGAVGLDFREDARGRLVALECNPRLTSGIHLFRDADAVAAAFLGTPDDVALPGPDATAMIGAAMLLSALPRAIREGAFGTWCRAFVRSRDVVLSVRDPWPGALQLAGLCEFGLLALRRRIGLRRATTFDIAWSGP